MSWFYNKIAIIFNSNIAAVGGLFAYQIDSFLSQYLQRLGGHLEEATSNLERILNSSVYQNMEESVRRTLELEAITRVDNLQKAYDTINGASFLTKPFKLMFVIEEKIFLAGAGIFIGTYAISANFDYRLIFLTLTFPYLINKLNSKLLVIYFFILIFCFNSFLYSGDPYSMNYFLRVGARGSQPAT